MADQKPETVSVPVPANMSAEQFMQFMSAFAGQITSGIAAGINEARPQKVTPGRYDPKTPFQPDKSKTRRLKRATYQNGTRLNPIQMFNSEIDLANKIVRSGRYINRLVEVIVHQDGSEEVVEIRYKNRSVDDRMELKSAFRSLEELLSKIVTEQDEKLAEEGALKAERKAFSSKATEEARARAAAREAEAALAQA